MSKVLSFFFLFFSGFCLAQSILLKPQPFEETIHNRTIQDPYRFLENSQDTLLKNWYQLNHLHTKELLNSIPARASLLSQFKEFDQRKAALISVIAHGESGAVYFIRKEEKDIKPILYKKNSAGEETLLFNPVEYSKKIGAEYTIAYVSVSWNEKYVTLNVVKKGEEIGEIIFLDAQNNSVLPIVLSNSWAALGGMQWLPDNSGILYLEIPVIDRNKPDYLLNSQSVVYKINATTNAKQIIFSKKNNPECNITAADFPVILNYSKQDSLLFANLSGVTNFKDTYYFDSKDLEKASISFNLLYRKEDGFSRPIYFQQYIYAISSKNTPNFSIVRTSSASPNFSAPEVVVKEFKEEVIEDYEVTPEALYFTTTKNGVQAKLYCYKNGVITEMPLPKNAGKIVLSIKNKYDNTLWITISGWLHSNERYVWDYNTNRFKEDTLSPIPKFPELENLVVEEIGIPAKDGTLIPVSIVRKKDMTLDGKNKVMLNSYGAYGVSIKPTFQTIYLTWVLRGGVYVVSHVRGGGEKGNAWYKAGFKETKPNTWNDLIATAEYLIQKKITSKQKLAIIGGSAGGITIGRAITERPDLFRVMIANACDFNVSRIKNMPNGPNNMKEFGNPDDANDFKNLLQMDAYQHIQKKVKYPSCFIDVGMQDARIPTWNSAKFVSKLRASTIAKNPIYFSIRYDYGHSSAIDQLNDKFADYFTFALWQLGDPAFTIKK